MNIIDLFTDPIFRGPTIGTLFMSLASALVGGITFIRRQSLVGETLSHATFPGVVIGMLTAGILFPLSDKIAFLGILIGAFVFSLLGHSTLEALVRKKVKSDASLCYVLASFLGLGVFLTSFLQRSHPIWYRKIQLFFYGQAATMTDMHIYVYGALSCVVSVVIIFLYRQIKCLCFDPIFSQSIGINRNVISKVLSILMSLAIVIGIRSVGVVLISGMLIVPAIVAKYWTKRFDHFLIVGSIVGMISALIGNYLSTLSGVCFGAAHHLPTGPAIVIVGCFFAFISLVFSPKEGLFFKSLRRKKFQNTCLVENILKALWKSGKETSLNEVLLLNFSSTWRVKKAMSYLKKRDLVEEPIKNRYVLTEQGQKKATYIVRLHRLWELYLVERLGSLLEHIHHSAEEMEHLITPEIESKLTELLDHPTKDPHQQPIPTRELP